MVRILFHTPEIIENTVLLTATKQVERLVAMMDRTNLEKYYASVTILFNLFSKRYIDKNEYLKGEEYLSDKHCIKIGNLYRRNDLI